VGQHTNEMASRNCRVLLFIITGTISDNCTVNIDCSAAVNNSMCFENQCVCLLGYQVSSELTNCTKREWLLEFKWHCVCMSLVERWKAVRSSLCIDVPSISNGWSVWAFVATQLWVKACEPSISFRSSKTCIGPYNLTFNKTLTKDVQLPAWFKLDERNLT